MWSDCLYKRILKLNTGLMEQNESPALQYLSIVLHQVSKKRNMGDKNSNLLASRIEKTLLVKFEFILSLLFTVVSDIKFSLVSSPRSEKERKVIELITAMIYMFEGEPSQLMQTQSYNWGLHTYPTYNILLTEFLDKFFEQLPNKNKDILAQFFMDRICECTRKLKSLVKNENDGKVDAAEAEDVWAETFNVIRILPNLMQIVRLANKG